MNYLTAKRSLFLPAIWCVVGILFCLFSPKIISGHEPSIYSLIYHLIAGLMSFFGGMMVCIVTLRGIPIWVKITIDENKTPLSIEEIALFGRRAVRPIDASECQIKSATIGGEIILPYGRFEIINLYN